MILPKTASVSSGDSLRLRSPEIDWMSSFVIVEIASLLRNSTEKQIDMNYLLVFLDEVLIDSSTSTHELHHTTITTSTF